MCTAQIVSMGAMSKISAQWDRELAKQRVLREKIAKLQRSFDWWKERTSDILRDGGPGWVGRIARANMKMQQVWYQLLRLTQSLYQRKVPV